VVANARGFVVQSRGGRRRCQRCIGGGVFSLLALIVLLTLFPLLFPSFSLIFSASGLRASSPSSSLKLNLKRFCVSDFVLFHCSLERKRARYEIKVSRRVLVQCPSRAANSSGWALNFHTNSSWCLVGFLGSKAVPRISRPLASYSIHARV
jgi:hypothetical protein